MKNIKLPVITLYFVAVTLVILLTDTAEMFNVLKLRALNRIMPPIHHLFSDKYPISRNKWEDYRYYYEKANSYVPEMPNAYGMVGFSHYQLGNISKAIEAYRKSTDLNPNFFWSHYNLGVLYFKDGKFKKAQRAFEAAYGVEMERSMASMLMSIVYHQIIVTNNLTHEQLAVNLAKGKEWAAIMQLQCLEKQNKIDELFVRSNFFIKSGTHLNGAALYFAGLAAMKAGDADLASKYFRKALEVNSNIQEAYNELQIIMNSTAFFRKKEARDAAKKMRQVKGMTPLIEPITLKIL